MAMSWHQLRHMQPDTTKERGGGNDKWLTATLLLGHLRSHRVFFSFFSIAYAIEKEETRGMYASLN